jgi:protein-arginine kinase activator protein McsA
MAIEIRIESSWDTDDGEGRTVEVTVCERAHPAEDPVEDTRYFAGGDREALKRYVFELVDAKWTSFHETRRRECAVCGNVFETSATEASVTCPDCKPSS